MSRTDERGVAVREALPLKGIRRLTAEQMVKSHQVPAVTSFGEADVTELVRLRTALAAEPLKTGGVAVTYTHLAVKAIAQALGAHPGLNATLAGEEILIYDEINIGVAVALPDGNLVVPVLHGADRLALPEIARRLHDLQERAARGKLTLPDVQRGTFTLTSFGAIPVLRWATPLLNPPQAAILGLGAIEERPVVRDGRIEVRALAPLSLTYDHRVVNGHAAGLFLQAVADLLAEPGRLELGIEAWSTS